MRTDFARTTHSRIARRAWALVLVCALGASLALGLVGCSSENSSSGETPGGSSADQPSAGSDYDPTVNEYNIIASGYAAPDFSFETMDGATAQLSDFEGNVVLLTFWASWCGYCMQDMPIINEVTSGNDNVKVVAVNRGDTTSDAIACAEELGYEYVWGLDEDGVIAELYPARGIPYTIIIGADGMIVDALPGSLPDMKSYLEETLAAAGA